MDSSKPSGSTTWTDPKLRAKMVVFLQMPSFFLRTISFSHLNRRESSRFVLRLEFSSPAQTCWELLWRFLQLIQSEQSDVQVRRAAVGLCFVALVASVTVSHRFRWTNSELYVSSLSWYWTEMFHCIFCAQCKPESDVQIHWRFTARATLCRFIPLHFKHCYCVVAWMY